MTASQLPIPEANVAKKRSRKRPSSRRLELATEIEGAHGRET